MLEKPKFKKGDEVRFIFNNGIKKIGIIVIVNIQGSLENLGKPSYDIFGKSEDTEDICLYKHVSEINVTRLIEIDEAQKEELNFIKAELKCKFPENNLDG